MNLIEALKKADGKRVARLSWNEDTKHYGVVFSGSGNRPLVYGNDVGAWEPTMEQLFADDWYVVEPQSLIEQAIDVEFRGIQNAMVSVRRIVNLTLDEAKKAAWGNGTIESAGRHCGSERIDALKVKL
jgi:hypothetical protein